MPNMRDGPLIHRTQEPSTSVELRTPVFQQIQPLVKYVSVAAYRIVRLVRPCCLLRLEVTGSSSGWRLVLSFELR
jgi:hypothetical protein